ncbi:MAG TPA: hypothetical protein DIW81_10595 [Planctomycetaceae bacterium]|nr:hypothetical protein [Rubinisphaera sp.]HCS52024.1 hypothetical protein [Planctomycetaceae bacterium]|tara:strand:- start:71 stop:268 length:198 start_codon:yes stop_codon:yes gene_type:complete
MNADAKYLRLSAFICGLNFQYLKGCIFQVVLPIVTKSSGSLIEIGLVQTLPDLIQIPRLISSGTA